MRSADRFADESDPHEGSDGHIGAVTLSEARPQRSLCKPANRSTASLCTNRQERCCDHRTHQAEILSGVRSTTQFDALRLAIDGLLELRLTTSTYDLAAKLYNHCRTKGRTPGATDVPISAAALQHRTPVYSIDSDFAVLGAIVSVTLY